MLLHGWNELYCVYTHLPHPFLCWKINVLLEEKRTRCPTCCVAAFFFLKCPGIPGLFCQGLVLSSTSCSRVRVVNAGLGAEDKSGLTYIGHWVVSFFSHCWQEATQGSLSWLSAQWYSLPRRIRRCWLLSGSRGLLAHLLDQEAEKRESQFCWLSPFPLLLQVCFRISGMVSPTFREGLSSSVSPLWKLPHRPTQKSASLLP